MQTLERRLTELERECAAYVGPSVLFIDGEPTAEQRAASQQAESMRRTVVLGELAPGQSAALLASLGTLAKLTEADEPSRRIEALEAPGTSPGAARRR
jgi:hypothetical protein